MHSRDVRNLDWDDRNKLKVVSCRSTMRMLEVSKINNNSIPACTKHDKAGGGKRCSTLRLEKADFLGNVINDVNATS